MAKKKITDAEDSNAVGGEPDHELALAGKINVYGDVALDASEADLVELHAMLDGHLSASDKALKLTLTRARALAKCSPTVQLALLLMNTTEFNMD